MNETVSVLARGMIENLLNLHALACMARAADNPRIGAEYMAAAARWVPQLEDSLRSIKRECDHIAEKHGSGRAA